MKPYEIKEKKIMTNKKVLLRSDRIGETLCGFFLLIAFRFWHLRSSDEVREAGTPHPRKKIETYLGIMGTRMAQEIIYGLFRFLKWGGGGPASREASANFFPEVLREI